MILHLRRLLAFMCLVLSPNLFAADGVAASNTSATNPRHRVVFAITVNDQHIWYGALGNFRNIQKDFGPKNVDIEMVVHGDGIDMLRDDSPAAERVAQAIADGVKVVACENTMKSRKMSHEEMMSNISYVPAGIVEIMRLQEAGWSYIKP